MRGTGAGDSRALPLSPRGRFLVHEDGMQELRGDPPKTPTGTTRPSSALKSTGHRLIHDELLLTGPIDLRDTPPKATTPRESSKRPSGRFQVQSVAVVASVEEFSPTSARVGNATSQGFSARLQPQDIEGPMTKHDAASMGSNDSSHPSSVQKMAAPLQLHEDTTSTSTQEVPVVSPTKSRPPSPVRQLIDLPQAKGVEIPTDMKESPSKTDRPLAPIRKNSDRQRPLDIGLITHKQDPLLKATKPISPIRQLSDRLKIHDDGAITSKKDVTSSVIKESAPIAPGAVDKWDIKDQNAKRSLEQEHHEDHTSETDYKPNSGIPVMNPSIEEMPQAPVSRFVPLHTQWTYGQAIFGRYKKTPYFYSGNIATYLGAGMFMVVFDDGTLDYRVRREDIMLREYPTSPTSPSNRRHRQHREKSSRGRRSSENSSANGSLRIDSFEAGDSKDVLTISTDSSQRRGSQTQKNEDRMSEDGASDPQLAPELRLLPSHHVMVDFSVSPPREIVLSFDDTASDCFSGCGGCGSTCEDNGIWRQLLEDETLTMKRLECGVGYDDDSTQVSDSDESSEEDMSMTPWQQMTQTFGMGKVVRGQRGTTRRSSISSVSQVDRLSMKQKNMKQIIASPKSFKQVIADYFMRGNKKVQPSKHNVELALAEHIRLMDAKLSSLKSSRCNGISLGSLPQDASNCLRVVYERAPDGVRAYGTAAKRFEDGGYAVVTEDEQSISMQAVPEDKLDFLPSACELEQQLIDLERSQRVLFAGQKVNVSLYPGSRFSGQGLITQERELQTRFHILLSNRIRLVNVPVDKISPVREKKKAAVTITEDQFLVCHNKVKVYIGDQIYVKCIAENGDLDDTIEEEKLGLLNGIYSNRTAAVDFADGSTGYEVPPHLIYKRKRQHVPADQDVRSLKNAVLMQASAAANGGTGTNLPVLEEGYQVKADHPSKASVESCIVIKTHASSACDLRFSDGTIAFEVFPSQMILDSVKQHSKPTNANERFSRAPPPSVYQAGDYVLAWSSRFGRYCSAKIVAKIPQDLSTPALAPPTVNSIVIPVVSPTTPFYTLAFDYGEYKPQLPLDKITRLDDTTALTHAQRLTNFSIDTMGFELSPVSFTVGEAVMARVHGSARYYNGVVENVDEKTRICAVCFDSSERDTAVPFSAMFSVDSRSRLTARSTSTKNAGSGSSSSEATSKARFISRQRLTEDATTSEVTTRPRRHSSGSVGNVLKSVAESIFRGSRQKASLEPRRGSQLITEVGARRRRFPEQ